MLIRCDRCSTLYELDEALLAPEGSPVQCTRCDHVFTARPPGTSAHSEVEAPGEARSEGPSAPVNEPAPRRPEPPRPVGEDDDAPDLPPGPAASPAPGPARQPAPPQRWDRPGPPVYRPGVTASAASGVARPPQIRRDAVGAFEARLRRNARWRWLGPALVVLVLAAIVAAWLLFSRRQGPVTERLRAEGLALVALDDTASLDQAVARFDESLRVAPRGREAEADRALAQVLRATALLEDGEALAARAAVAQAADRAAAAALADASEPAAAPAPSPETARLQAGARDRTARGTDLSRKAQQALQKLEADKVAVLEVARALALQHAAAGERDAARKYLATGRARAADDPWLGLAEATLDVRATDRAGRERGVAELSALTGRHPELLRARYLLAAAQATLGRRAEAQAAVDGILAANPRHERAEALRAELARAPVAPATPAQAAAGGSVTGNGATAPRNAASQPPPQKAVANPGGAPAPSAATATQTARAGRAGTAAPVPATTGGAPSAGRKAPPGGPAGGPSTPAAARPAPLRPRPRPAPEARPVEFGDGG